MKSLLSSTPVLRLLFWSTPAAAVAAAFGLDGAHALVTSVGLGVVSFSAGRALMQRSFDRAVRARLRPLGGTREEGGARRLG